MGSSGSSAWPRNHEGFGDGTSSMGQSLRGMLRWNSYLYAGDLVKKRGGKPHASLEFRNLEEEEL
jgi:hypothetical protein